MENTPKFDIDKTAALSMLFLNESEKAEFARDMEKIVAFAEKISSCEEITEEIRTQNSLREDDTLPSFPREDMLKNSKTAKDGFISVPQVVGSEE